MTGVLAIACASYIPGSCTCTSTICLEMQRTSVALAANLDWSRLCKQMQYSGSAEGAKALGHCADFVAMCCKWKEPHHCCMY